MVTFSSAHKNEYIFIVQNICKADGSSVWGLKCLHLCFLAFCYLFRLPLNITVQSCILMFPVYPHLNHWRPQIRHQKVDGLLKSSSNQFDQIYFHATTLQHSPKSAKTTVYFDLTLQLFILHFSKYCKLKPLTFCTIYTTLAAQHHQTALHKPSRHKYQKSKHCKFSPDNLWS